MLTEILQKYWNYSDFRPLQKEIIESVLAGNDTLALMPTGGGKSLCFQVPALAQEGLCLVISPLIALMKDQVEQLQKRGITAEALFSGMDGRLIDKILNEAIDGKLKFLYISPERLKTEAFRERAKLMKISLLAIDEAHCISQWGYDFRPPYLAIAEFRALYPQIPLIALTATATEKVKLDIQEKLQFRANAQVFQKSYARANLSYSVRLTENKEQKLLEILQKIRGSAVVYVRNRRKTQETAEMLARNGISADYYHAGLNHQLRSFKQENWLQNKIRVMVATNAFGMGIDKPDVRIVVHIDLPDSLEAYYQEAGRAGRDEKTAFAVALYYPNDLADLEQRILLNYPELEFVRTVYQALANYFNLPVGAGEMSTYDFDLTEFQRNFNFKGSEVYQALKILEAEGLIQFNDYFHNPARAMFVLNRQDLYDFQFKNPKAEPIIRLLLRIYEGIQNHFVTISESTLAKYLQVSNTMIIKQLERLQELNILAYTAPKDKPQILFLSPRYEVQNLPLNFAKIEERKKRDLEKVKAVSRYIENAQRCRTQLLLEYFGEISYDKCGICDTCLKNKKDSLSATYESLSDEIIAILAAGPLAIKVLVEKITSNNENLILQTIRQMIEVKQLKNLDDGRISLTETKS